MADYNFEDITSFTLRCNDETAAGIDSARKNLAGLDTHIKNSSEEGSRGFHVLGLASAKLGEELGIPYRASHMLGTQLSHMAMNAIPAWGSAAGAAAAALFIVGSAIAYVRNENEKHREEVEKTVSSYEQEVRSLYANRLETYEVVHANEELAKARRKVWQDDISDKINLDSLALLKQKQHLETLYKSDPATATQKLFSLMGNFYRKDVDDFEAAARSKDKVVEDSINAEIKLLKASWETPTKDLFDPERLIKSRKDQEDYVKYVLETRSKALEVDTNYYKERASLTRTYSIDNEEILAADLDAFDAETEQKVILLDTLAKREDYLSLRAMQRMRTEVDYRKKVNSEEADAQVQRYLLNMKLEEQLANNKIAMLQGLEQATGQLYDMSHSKMRAFYYVQQVAAAGEAFIQYQLAAAKVSGQAGWLGLTMAGYYEAMSYIVPGLIMAKTFTSGAGGGGGSSAVPTFSSSPATGLPTAQAAAPPNIYISMNGGGFSKMDLTNAVVQTLYQNNGSIGGLSVQVQKST